MHGLKSNAKCFSGAHFLRLLPNIRPLHQPPSCTTVSVALAINQSIPDNERTKHRKPIAKITEKLKMLQGVNEYTPKTNQPSWLVGWLATLFTDISVGPNLIQHNISTDLESGNSDVTIRCSSASSLTEKVVQSHDL